MLILLDLNFANIDHRSLLREIILYLIKYTPIHVIKSDTMHSL